MAIKRLSPVLSATEVLDRVLDKGIVIDADIRIAVAGIELITVSATIRVASFETWDRYVAATERAARARRALGDDAKAHGSPASAAPHRVRLRCEDGCTFERRASALALRDGAIAPQRCAVKPRRACAVTVI
ncbi:MAG TPA: gas vesicle protein GvpJ [Methylomirabilota bacterium]|jgi:hypothetical protein|nr:gas vesicle protein GvpJ [Methylomirabilota bacterium]